MVSKFFFVCVCICLVLLIDLIWCLENTTSSEVADEARKRKRPFHHLVNPWHSYSVVYGLFALKLKVIVITITVVGILGIFAHMFVMPFVGRWLFKKNTCEYPEHVYLDHPPTSYVYKEYGADTGYGVPGVVTNDRKQTVKDSYLPQRRSKRQTNKRIFQTDKQSWIKSVCRQRVRCEQQTKQSLTKSPDEKKLISPSSTSSLITGRCLFLRKICPDQILSNLNI